MCKVWDTTNPRKHHHISINKKRKKKIPFVQDLLQRLDPNKVMIKRPTKKQKEWEEAKKRLWKEYKKAGITTCEGRAINPTCLVTGFLAIHHLDKRSSGKATHSFEQTRLLCGECHFRADNAKGHEDFNNKLRQLR